MWSCLRCRRLFCALACLFSILILLFPKLAGAVDVTLAWDPVAASDLAGYKIYYRSCAAGTGCTSIGGGGSLEVLMVSIEELTDRTAPEYTVRMLPADSDFVFVVSAYTEAGLESGFSNEAFYSAPISGDGSTAPGTDSLPPSTPLGLSAVMNTEAGGISLAWSQSSDTDTGVERYAIYRDSIHLADAVAPLYIDTDVTAGATYNYFVTAIDAAGNASEGSKAISITLPETLVPDNPSVGDSMVIDNRDGSFTTKGNWRAASFIPGYYGEDYHYSAPGNGSRQVFWSFPVQAGQYVLSARWSAYENRASDARYRVLNNGVELGWQIFDQRVGGGVFNLFDQSFIVNTGTLDVLLSDAADGYIVADAVQAKYLGDDGTAPPDDSLPPEPIIVDNREDAFSVVGRWGRSSFTPGYYLKDYHYAEPGDGELSAVWTFAVSDGAVDISARWCAYSNRASNAEYRIYNNGAYLGAQVWNQQQNGGRFNAFGTFTVNAGTLTVVLDNDANGYVIADAVKVE